MIHQTCYCDVKPEKIDDVIEHTKNWLSTLHNEYDEPIHYEAFQENENPNVICYYITFTDKNAEEDISSQSQPRQFGEKLYSMCKADPVWKYHNVIAGFRNSQKDSKIHMMVKYKIKPEKLDEVKKGITEFVEEIRKNEQGTRVYEVWQQQDEPTNFTHLDGFADEKSVEFHKNASHTKKFVGLLYPNCVDEPKFISAKQIGSKELK